MTLASWVGVTCEMSASAVANITDAPRPCTARDATSISIPLAAPHNADIAVNSASPMRKSLRRPSRSAIAPAVRTVAANGIV